MTDISSVIRFVFWAFALSTLIAMAAIISPMAGLPQWGMWTIAGVGGAIVGLLVCDWFARRQGIKELYDEAPVNGATGVRISFAELLVPYAITTFLLAVFLETVSMRREARQLPPLTLPGWLAYLPVAATMVTIVLLLWFRAKRTRR
jgi:hypothetical protein